MPIEFTCISREGLGQEFNGSFASYTECSDKTLKEMSKDYGGVWKDEESWDTKYPLTGRTPIPYNRTTYAKGTLLKYSGVIVNDLNQSCGKTCGQGFKVPIEFSYQNFDALSSGYLDMDISGWKEMIDVITSSGDPRRI